MSVIANRHLYTGRLWLSEIGLYEYRHRYYDPSLGRFISRDPAGYAFGLNLYAYLNGNPMAFIDPFGLCPVKPDVSALELLLALRHELWGDAGWPDAFTDGLTSLLDGTASQLLADAAVDAETNVARRTGGEVSENGVSYRLFLQSSGQQDTVSALTGYDASADQLIEGTDRLAAGLRGGGSTFLLANAAYGGATGLARGVQAGLASEASSAAGSASSAASLTNANKLNKALASTQQVRETGIPIAGKGTNTPYRDAGRVANQHGGSSGQWVKMRSQSHVAPDGTRFETHWVENIKTGQQVEFKTKLN